MNYISVKEYAQKWGISERTVRNRCASGRINGVFLTGKTWNIPYDSLPPARSKGEENIVENPLLERLNEERAGRITGGIYQRTQIDLTYNSNSIEGSRLVTAQIRHIFETNNIGVVSAETTIDEITETINHFRCIDFIIEFATSKLSEPIIKQIHNILMSSTSHGGDIKNSPGRYKSHSKSVNGNETTAPGDVSSQMAELLDSYHAKRKITFEDIVDFHQRFEVIHPFTGGNGRVGRLIIFKECLAHNIIPTIIDSDTKSYYYLGLQNWPKVKGYLMETCLTGQYNYRGIMALFKCPWQI